MAKAKSFDELRVYALDFGRRVEQFASDTVGQQYAQGDNHRVILIAQGVRMLRTFQAALTLVEADLCDAAGAILRCLLEQYFVFRALYDDPSLLPKAVAEVEGEMRKAIRGLLRMNAADRADETTNASLQEALEQLKDESGFNVFEWAERTGQQSTYLTLYRLLSNHAHGSLAILEKYIQVSDAGLAVRIVSRIGLDEGISFVLVAASLMLETIKSLDNQPYTEARRARHYLLSQESQTLLDNYWDLQGSH